MESQFRRFLWESSWGKRGGALGKWSLKNQQGVIPRAVFARGICFVLAFCKNRFLASLGMTLTNTFSATC
jgi:hypothetical protein